MFQYTNVDNMKTEYAQRTFCEIPRNMAADRAKRTNSDGNFCTWTRGEAGDVSSPTNPPGSTALSESSGDIIA